MRFSATILFLSLLAVVASSPMPKKNAASSTSPAVVTATACAAGAATNTSKVTAAADGSVLKASTYNAISISGGTAGNAEVRTIRLFNLLPSDILKYYSNLVDGLG
jgi:hypothetical protein